jgi:uncharacterized membrane protein
MLLHPIHGLHWSARISALGRQFFALVPALAVGWTLGRRDAASPVTALLAAWVVYFGVYLGFVWWAVLRLDAPGTRRRAQWNDPGAPMLFAFITLASCASLAAVLLAVNTARSLHGPDRWLHLVLALLSLGGAWLLIQTAFALRYARAYYRPHRAAGEPPRGLAFPGGEDPDYLDFFYFAAVIGMTSQVSDVTLQTRAMRRLGLAHGLLSFAFNLVVLALAVNVFAASLA